MNLKTQTTDGAKFERAAKLADVSITERTDFANGTSVVVLKFKRPDQLINLGMYFGLEEAKTAPKDEAEVDINQVNKELLKEINPVLAEKANVKEAKKEAPKSEEKK